MNGSATARKRNSAGERGPLRRYVFLDHYPQLLAFIYTWRYATAEIVLRCFADQIASPTTARYQLRALRSLGYLKAERSYADEPFTYSVTQRAIRHLRQHFNRPFPMTSDGAVSPFILEHERTTSRVQTDIYLAAAGRPDLTILGFERRYFRAANRLPYVDADGESRFLNPDLGFLLRQRSQDGSTRILQHFVEVDRGTERPAVVLNKLMAYHTWHQTVGQSALDRLYRQHGQDNPKPTFRCLIVTRHRRTGDSFDQLVRLYAQALRVPPPTRSTILLTTLDAMERHPNDSTPIWYPLHRFKPSRLAAIADDLSDPTKQKAIHQFVAAQLRQMTPYRLYAPAQKPVIRST